MITLKYRMSGCTRYSIYTHWNEQRLRFKHQLCYMGKKASAIPTLYWSFLQRRHTQTTDMPSDLIWPIFVLQWIWIWDEFHTRSKWSYDLWPTWKTGKKLKESHSHRFTTVCKEGSAKLAAKPILVQGEECQLTLFRNTGLYDRYVKQGRRWSLVLVSRWQCVGLTGMKAPFSLLITCSKALTGTSSDTVICVIHDSHTL